LPKVVLRMRRNVDGNTALGLRNPQLAPCFPRGFAVRKSPHKPYGQKPRPEGNIRVNPATEEKGWERYG